MLDWPKDILNRSTTLFGHAGYHTSEATGGVPLALRLGVLVNTVLLLVGIVFLIITVYSGITWMAAGGQDEKIELAQKRIKRAIIGLIIVMGAWVLTVGLIKKASTGPIDSQSGAVRLFRR